MLDYSFVYILAFPERGAFKIGKARSLENRSLQLMKEWGTPDFEQSHYIEIPSLQVSKLERFLQFSVQNFKKEMPYGDGYTEFYDLRRIHECLAFVRAFCKAHGEAKIQVWQRKKIIRRESRLVQQRRLEIEEQSYWRARNIKRIKKVLRIAEKCGSGLNLFFREDHNLLDIIAIDHNSRKYPDAEITEMSLSEFHNPNNATEQKFRRRAKQIIDLININESRYAFCRNKSYQEVGFQMSVIDSLIVEKPNPWGSCNLSSGPRIRWQFTIILSQNGDKRGLHSDYLALIQEITSVKDHVDVPRRVSDFPKIGGQSGYYPNIGSEQALRQLKIRHA